MQIHKPVAGNFVYQNYKHLHMASVQVKWLFFVTLVLVWFTVAWQVGF